MKNILYLLTLFIMLTACKKDKKNPTITGTWQIESSKYYKANGNLEMEFRNTEKEYLEFFENGSAYHIYFNSYNELEVKDFDKKYSFVNDRITFKSGTDFMTITDIPVHFIDEENIVLQLVYPDEYKIEIALKKVDLSLEKYKNESL